MKERIATSKFVEKYDSTSRRGYLTLYLECTKTELVLSTRLSPNPVPDPRCGNCFEMCHISLVALLSFSYQLRDWSMILHWAVGGYRAAWCAIVENEN